MHSDLPVVRVEVVAVEVGTGFEFTRSAEMISPSNM